MNEKQYVILETEELLKKFPVVNPTPVDTDMEKKIQNRLLCGFENWNRGFDAWKAWGDVLYTPESIYNVHAVKLSLEGYQTAMKLTLRNNDIQMGDFYNMVIAGDWCAIHYAIKTINRESGTATDGSVMEFVKFTDLGGVRGAVVAEGWAGTRGADFDGLSRIQDPKLRAVQDKLTEAVLRAVLPETDDMSVKYPVAYPTAIRNEMGYKMRNAILRDFDMWNKGADAWCEWADSYYTSDYKHIFNKDVKTLAEYKQAVKDEAAGKDIQRICFDNMLISGEWAALHYHIVTTDKATGERVAGNRMQFLHFVEDRDTVRVDAGWTK
ncbi:MAG: nuclear transport factor 2 family protein [Muribaculaceae bacterium]|nr:nuclear transport factor 2 family protein [Muribaculaceae bacterium]